MIDAPAAFIGDAWMRTVIARKPVVGCVAGGAIQAEHSSVEDRVNMTTCTSS